MADSLKAVQTIALVLQCLTLLFVGGIWFEMQADKGSGASNSPANVTQEANPTINVDARPETEGDPLSARDYLSPSEAAIVAGRHIDTIYTYLVAGRIPGATQDTETGRWQIPADFKILPKSG